MKKNLFFLIFLSFFVFGCSGGGDQGPTGPNEQAEPAITFVPGKVLRILAQEESIYVESPEIKNELDETIPDGIEFILTGDDGITFSPDDIDFTSSITLSSKDGKFSFYAKIPTEVGSYRVEAKPKDYQVVGRYFIQVDPGVIHDIGSIRSSRFEDLNSNGVRDPGEKYSILADGESTAFVVVGPVHDAFGNQIEEGQIQITIDQGNIISDNPVSLSDGYAYIRLQSNVGSSVANVEAWALDINGQVLNSTRITGDYHFVAPNLEIIGDGSFGFVFLGETETKTFTLRNSGDSKVSTMNFSIDAPFVLESKGACDGKNFLLPGEECELTVSFLADVNTEFTGNIQIIGSPSSSEGASVIFPLQAFGAKAPEIRVESSSFDFGAIACGTTKTLDLVVTNIGDFPAENLQVVNPPPHDNQSDPFFTLTIPPADPNPSPDTEAIINCGTTLPGNRRCRVIMSFDPLALVTNQPLTAQLSVDGQNPIQVTLRGSSFPGVPGGVPPIQFFDNNGQPTTGMDLINTAETTVRVGPFLDVCGNKVSEGTEVSGTVSGGTLLTNTEITNDGFVSFLWKGSDDINLIGNQSVSISSGNAANSSSIVFKGVKLVLTGESDLGQVLNVLPKTFSYTLRNEGTITARNLSIDTDSLSGEDPFILTSLGGCADQTLGPQEQCTIVLEVNSSNFDNPQSLFSGLLRTITDDIGQNLQELSLTGRSELPPVLEFSSSLFDLGTHIAGESIPEQTLTLTNNSPADTFDLSISIPAPFTIVNNLCGTELLAAQSCDFTVRLDSTTRGTYSSNVAVDSEFSTGQTFVTTFIAPNKASGAIPMSVDTPSVPADNATEITINLGPVRDQYGNIVATGTNVEVQSDTGRLSLDNDQDGKAIVQTNLQGRASIKIRSASFTEIQTFTVNSRVYDTDGITQIASGSVQAEFTGVIMSFVEDSVDYGDVPVGNVKLQTITLRNLGNETATNVGVSSTSSDFIISDTGTCVNAATGGATLAEGASCVITVAFFPVSNNTVTGAIQASSSGNGVLTDSVSVQGKGILPAKLVASVDSIFAPIVPGQNYQGTFNITNQGNEAITDFQISVADNSNEFSFSAAGCVDLGAQSTCTVNFTYTPSSPDVLETTITVSGEGSTRTTVDNVSFTSQPAQIQFSEIPFNQGIDECGEIKVQALDFSGNPINAASNVSLSLQANLGSFYSNNTCSNSITSIVLAQGQTETSSFYFKSGQKGDATVEVDGSGLYVEAIIQVFKSLEIIPENDSSVFVQNTSKYFEADGGIPPFVWQIAAGTGLSNGTTSQGTKRFTVDNSDASGSYQIKVTDNIGNTFTLTGTKAPGLVISPTSISLDSGTQTTFSASGGSGSYSFYISSNGGIGSSITNGGVYTAGENTTENPIVETITLEDSFGATITAEVTVKINKYKLYKYDDGTSLVDYDDVFIYDDMIFVNDARYSSYTGEVFSFIHDGSSNANFSAGPTFPGFQSGERFGRSIYMNQDYFIVGASHSNETGGFSVTNAGAAYYWAYDGNTFTYKGRIQNPNLGANQYFGTSVAVLTSPTTGKAHLGIGMTGKISGVDGSFEGFNEFLIGGNPFGWQPGGGAHFVSPYSYLDMGVDIAAFSIGGQDFFLMGGQGFIKTYKVDSAGNWSQVNDMPNSSFGGISSYFALSVDTSTGVAVAAVGVGNDQIKTYEFNSSTYVWTHQDTITNASSEAGTFGQKIGFKDKHIATCGAGNTAYVYKSSNGKTGWSIDLQVQEVNKICNATDISDDLLIFGFDSNGSGDSRNYLYLYKINK